jgi:hypothetical protein
MARDRKARRNFHFDVAAPLSFGSHRLPWIAGSNGWRQGGRSGEPSHRGGFARGTAKGEVSAKLR